MNEQALEAVEYSANTFFEWMWGSIRHNRFDLFYVKFVKVYKLAEGNKINNPDILRISDDLTKCINICDMFKQLSKKGVGVLCTAPANVPSV